MNEEGNKKMFFGDFYWERWRASRTIAEMTHEEVHAYISMLSWAWATEAYLPPDIVKIESLLRRDISRAAIKSVLEKCFQKDERGYYNEVQRETYAKAKERSDKQALNATKRWHPESEATTPSDETPPQPRRSPSTSTQEDIDRVNVMAQAWNTTLGALGVPKAHGYDTAKVQGEKLAARLRSNPWIFEKADAIMRGAAAKYADMISERKAAFLTFGWLASAPLAKLEALANYEAPPRKRKL